MTGPTGNSSQKEREQELLRIKLERLAALEAKDRLREGLPHLYGWKWYKWAREFFESRNRLCFITAANQISKSSTQIRKVIEFAGNTNLWPVLWRSKPKIFWYFYPSAGVATAEVKHKWIPEFLPRNEFKDHPTYGWNLEEDKKQVKAIHFNSGVSVYFKSYEQDVANLQTATVYYVAIDEELPVDMWDEIQLRTQAVDGYISMVFTATLGQDFWRRVMELRGTSAELLPEADKWQVSMYDCLYYEDGTRSHWTEEKINRVKALCRSKNEILKRVYGRFVNDSGLKYPGFDPTRNIKEGGSLPQGWNIFVGVDPGGGGSGHPSAIAFVAVDPLYQKGRIIKLWRGDGIITTAYDTYVKYRDMREAVERQYGRKVSRKFYDWASKDFYTIAERCGEVFESADKSHDVGEDILNGLFKNDMLSIDSECGAEADKLSVELTTVIKNVAKKNLRDDLIDAVRYAITKLPWDFSVVSGSRSEDSIPKSFTGGVDLLLRDGKISVDDLRQLGRLPEYDEFEEWNELY